MNKKIEVNSEIKEIKRLIEENEINKAEFKAFELAESIFPYKNNGDPYFTNECVNVISKIIMKEYKKNCKEEINIDYIINNFEELSKEVIDVVVKGIVNGGVIAYVEGVRGFIPASKLALNYVEDTNEYLNKPIQVQVFDIDKEKGRLILSAKEILREKAEEERKTKISNVQVGLVTEGVVESLQPYGAFVDLGNGLSGLVHISQICEKRIKKPSEVLTVGDKVKVKVTAVKDGKLSLSIKEATDMMAKEIEEEVIELPDSKEEASTSLGALFANIKLDN